MNLPYAEQRNVNSDATTVFSGLCREPYCPDGNFTDMENLSGDLYPFLSTRKARGTVPLSGIYSMTPVEILSGGEIIECFACVKKGYKSGSFNGFSKLTLAKDMLQRTYAYIYEKLSDETELVLSSEDAIKIVYKDEEGKSETNTVTTFKNEGYSDRYYIGFFKSFSNKIDHGKVFEIVSDFDMHTCVFFYDENGNEVAERICIDGEAEKTTLISQAGYLYAFPQGIRIPLLSDEPVERLAADITIRNATEPSETGGYSADPIGTYNVINVDGSLPSNGVGVVTDKQYWDNNYYRKAQYFNAFLIRGEQTGKIFTGILERNYYFEAKDKTYSLVDLAHPQYMAVTAKGTVANEIFYSASIGDKFVIDLESLTKTVKIYKPQNEAEFEIVLTPSDEEGTPLTTGVKAETFYTRENTTAGGRGTNELIIFKNVSSTGTNIYGAEVVCGSDGIVTEVRGYGMQNASVPTGGFVISGHGTARAWIINNISVGNYISYDSDLKKVYVYESGDSLVVTKKPDNPINGMRWYDDVSGGMYVYSAASGMWVSMPNNYVTLSLISRSLKDESGTVIEPVVEMTVNGEATEHFTEALRDGDLITVSGLSEELDSSYIIEKVLDNALVLNASLANKNSTVLPYNASIRIQRKIPKMDYVTECANRIWGCRYGVDEDGKVINEIYASALGDPRNFYRYQGISTDSWTATVGVPGKFTGAVKYGDYPLFFKENAVIRVFGSSPSSYQTADYRYRGVMEGSHKSVVIVDEVLYYLSRDGVLAFSGSSPTKIDTALGRCSLSDGVAGELSGKLYINALEDGKRQLFTFDTKNGTWHREDCIDIVGMVRRGNILYYVLSDGSVMTANGGGESPFNWHCVTGSYGYGDIYKKRLEKVRIRAVLPLGSRLSVMCSYDGGAFEPTGEFTGHDGEIMNISFIPKRCESFRLKLLGKGECRIITVYRETKHGGDR